MATTLSSHYQSSTNGTSATSPSLQSTTNLPSPKLSNGVQGGSILKNRLAKSSNSALDVALGTDTAHRLHATGGGSQMKKARKPSYPQSKTFPAELSPLSRMNQHRNVLEKYRQSPPSLVLHIHPTHFRFEQQDGVFLFSSPLKGILEYIRNQKLPADLMDVFDETKVKFYDGCIIVEIRDHRPRNNADTATKSETNGVEPPADPSTAVEIRRVALKPTAESIWSDLCLLNESHGGRFSQEVALELESKILLCTAPPLCLEPNVRVSRIGNAIVRSQYGTSAAAVDARKRKRNVGKNSKEMEEDAVKNAESQKIMAIFSEKNSEFLPSFSRIAYVQDWRRKRNRADAEPAPTLDPKRIKGNKTAKKQAIQEQSMLSDGRRILRTIKCEREEGVRNGESEKRKIYTTVILYQEGKDKYESVFRTGSSPDTSVDGLTFRQYHKTELLGDAHLDHLKKLLQINNKFEVDIRSTEGPPTAKPASVQLSQQQQQQTQHAQLQQAALRAAAAAAAGGNNNLQGTAGAIAAQMARQASLGLNVPQAAGSMSMAGSPMAVNASIPLQQPGTVGHSANAMAVAAAAQMANMGNNGQQSMLNSPDLRLLQKQIQQQQAHAQAQQGHAGPARNNQMSPQQQQQQALRMQAMQQQNPAAAAAAASASPQMNRASPQQQPLGLQGVSAAAMIAQMPLLMQQAQNPQQVAQLRQMLQHLQRQQIAQQQQQQQQQQIQAQAVAAARAAGGQGQAGANAQNSPSTQARPSPAAQQAQIQQLLQAQAAQQRQQVAAAQAQQQNIQQGSPLIQQQQRPGGLSLQNLAAAGISPQILFAAQQRGINLNNLNLSQLQQLSQLSQISGNNQNANAQNQQAALAAAAAAAVAQTGSASPAPTPAMSPVQSAAMGTPSSPTTMQQGTSATALAAAAAAAIKNNNAGNHATGPWSQHGHQQAAAALALQAQSHQVQAQANAQFQADAHAKAQAQIQALQAAIQRGTVSPELLQRLQLAQNTATLKAQQAARAKAQAEAQSLSLQAAQAAASAQASTRQGTGTPIPK